MAIPLCVQGGTRQNPVPVQGRRADAGRGGISRHGRGGVADRRGIVLLPEAKGAASVASSESRGVSSRGERRSVLSARREG